MNPNQIQLSLINKSEVEKERQKEKEKQRLDATYGTQKEQLARNQEKLFALQTELNERMKQHKELNDRFNEELKQRRLKKDRDYLYKNEYEAKEEELDEFSVKVNEKIDVHLNRLYSSIDKKLNDEFNDFKADVEKVNVDDVSEEYTKAFFPAICVKYIEPTEEQKFGKKFKSRNKEKVSKEDKINQEQIYFNSFRISKKITFGDLKAKSCEFWGLEPDEKKNNPDKYPNYELLDESLASLQNSKEYVDRYFLGKQSEFSQGMVILRYKDTSQSNNPEEGGKNVKGKSALRVKNNNSSVKLKDKDKQVDDTDLQVEFFKKFPGMKHYIKFDSKAKKNISKKKPDIKDHEFDDNHCCIFLLILILTVLHILTLSKLNVLSLYYANNSIIKNLGLESPLHQTAITADSYFVFSQISNIDDFWSYFENYAHTYFMQDSPTNKNVSNKYLVMGVTRIRILETKSTECKGIITKYNPITCYYSEYNQNTQAKGFKQLITGDHDKILFMSSQQSQQSSISYGYFASYDGSGFIHDFGWDDKKEVFKNFIQSLIDSEVVNEATRAVFFTQTLYNMNEDIYTYINLFIEISPSGIFFPHTPDVISFRPNIYGDDLRDLKILDIIKIILCVFLGIFLIYFVACGTKFSEFLKMEYIGSFQGICNILIIVFTSISFKIGNSQSELGFSDFNMHSGFMFTDYSFAALYFFQYFQYQALTLGILITRLVTTLKINKRFKIIIMTIERSSMDLFLFGFILIPILMGYAYFGMQIWGFSISNYRTFGRSIISVMMLTIGQLDINEMLDTSFYWTIFFLSTFYFLVVFFLLSYFLAIYIDNYRLVILDIGFMYEKEESWGMKDYLNWILAPIPKKFKKKLPLTREN